MQQIEQKRFREHAIFKNMLLRFSLTVNNASIIWHWNACGKIRADTGANTNQRAFCMRVLAETKELSSQWLFRPVALFSRTWSNFLRPMKTALAYGKRIKLYQIAFRILIRAVLDPLRPPTIFTSFFQARPSLLLGTVRPTRPREHLPTISLLAKEMKNDATESESYYEIVFQKSCPLYALIRRLRFLILRHHDRRNFHQSMVIYCRMAQVPRFQEQYFQRIDTRLYAAENFQKCYHGTLGLLFRRT